jgi:hypothetical protein
MSRPESKLHPRYKVVAPLYWVVDTRTNREMVCFTDEAEALECARKSNELWRERERDHNLILK